MKKKTLWLLLSMVGASAWGQKAVERSAILQLHEWKQIYETYVPDAAVIDSLRNKVAGFRADVYFGFWCDDSKKHVPVFLKIVDSLNVPEFAVNFFEVDKKSVSGQKYYAPGTLVEKVPTFIFYRRDSESGRIVENPKDSLLMDMMLIMF
ncbi:MAG: thioredoxin family protein [Candidatus Aminicenantes bacterium]|nr:thioredoxin family protein [Candidatus Aminicenantes bacterium]